ncbi:MAG TPA: phage protein GemA/Gp16 family protein [Nitrospiria bacterium]|nr:phage protein GemA/Gp16 family protein [Nitrospiria bacterium]
MDRITNRQLRAVWAIAHRAGLNEREVHAEVESLSGKSSIRLLTRREAAAVIDRLLGLKNQGSGVRGQGPAREPQYLKTISKERLSAAQLFFIEALGEQAGWETRRVLGLARRMYGVDGLQSLDRRQASGLIEALKTIKRRRAA